MRHPALPRILAVAVAAATAVAGLMVTPTLAAPRSTVVGTHAVVGTANPAVPPPSADTTGTASEDFAGRSGPVPAALRGKPASLTPKASSTAATRPHAATRSAGTQVAAQSCTPADFGSRTGSALVSYIEASTQDCIGSLFAVKGTDAYYVFRESQMLTVANAFGNLARNYPGDDSTRIQELIYYLRAGYFVQFYDTTDVGSYDATLTAAAKSAMDAFFASPHSADVNDINGGILGEVITLTDSADLQGGYLSVYKRILNAYNSSYDAFWNMDAAVNAVYTPLWRGNQNPDFVTAVTADPSIIDTLSSFALNHLNLLGGVNDVLDSNAGNDLARMVANASLQTKIRPLAKGLLGASSITGPTASLWVHVAYQLSQYDDPAQCSYYGICDLTARLTAASLPTTYTCDNRTILAQALNSADLAATCASLRGQDPYFHNLIKDSGPIPGQYTSTSTLAVFASKFDYSTYSWVIFGNDTNNGGETLSDPTNPNNKPTSVMYQKPTDDGFVARIWNLNHEYTHQLDSRYNTKGTFSTEISVPDIWWIEGVAEYVSYSYRGVVDTEAITDAGLHTYNLSTLWQSTYDNSNVTRTYPWGYLAVRFMFEKHPTDIYNMLSHFRTGDYTGGYAVYNTGIGTRYDAEFNAWLDTLSGPTTPPACTATDNRALGQNCSRGNQSAATGNTDYLYIYLPAGTTTLTVSTTGGTGNADLYYNPSTWASPSAYSAKSTNSGNAESITVTNTAAGYRYISLYAQTAFSGVTVSTRY